MTGELINTRLVMRTLRTELSGPEDPENESFWSSSHGTGPDGCRGGDVRGRDPNPTGQQINRQMSHSVLHSRTEDIK